MTSFRAVAFALGLLAIFPSINSQFCKVKNYYTLVPYDLIGACPNIKYVKELDFSQNVGTWYLVLTNFENILYSAGCAGNCLTGVVSRLNTTHYSINSCCKRQSSFSNMCGPAIGSGTLRPDPVNRGIVYYGTTPTYHLEVQYDCYRIILWCSLKADKTKDEFVEVYVRDPSIHTPDFERYIRTTLSNNGANVTNIYSISHAGCPTSPLG